MISIEEVESLAKELHTTVKKLKENKVVRSEKHLSDIVEWVVAKRLKLELAPTKNQEGYDAYDSDGKKYQIKYRSDDENKNTGFDHLKNSDGKLDGFDFLLCAFLDKDSFKVKSIYKVPIEIVKLYVKEFKRTNSFRWDKKSRNDSRILKVYPIQ